MDDFADFSGAVVEDAEYVGPYYDTPFDWPEPEQGEEPAD